MRGFDRLHEALQYHVVNSLGWPALRPHQDAAVAPIVDGQDCLILAPTAGGKTEAAVLPALSRMLSEDWRGQSVLYLCPIKALLNNLEPRLAYYAGLVGRRVGLWHGDVSDSVKSRLRREPPDLLLTTPESLEGMLISRRHDQAPLFAGLRLVIVDELHAFAGDDRGWHLRAVLTRLGHYCQARPQRIGLSATVGNPQALLDWFSGAADAAVVGEARPPAGGELTIDHVGSIEGAATVLERLYRGDKRLVFCDSRAKVEHLTGLLRTRGVTTFASHSSLSAAERRDAERAFAAERDCVIVATSTLELGIDVGDLDRVLQIDAPGSVSSLLQRMGRTGRRAGMPRNCTFLAVRDEGLVGAAALCALLASGYTEPVVAPRDPWHLVAQQAMALLLERGATARGELERNLRGLFEALDPPGIGLTLDTMIERGILWDDAGQLWFGPAGEREYGARNFLELVSSFTSPQLFRVQHGQQELGFVDPVSLAASAQGPAILSLGGRSWRVQSSDWKRRVVWVEPTDAAGRSQWLGATRGLPFALAQAMKRVLTGGDVAATLSARATARLAALRDEHDFLVDDATSLVEDAKGGWTWWTFAGTRGNSVLAATLTGLGGPAPRALTDLGIEFSSRPEFEPADLGARVPDARAPADVEASFVDDLKFASCLPDQMKTATAAARLIDPEAAIAIARLPVAAVRAP